MSISKSVEPWSWAWHQVKVCVHFVRFDQLCVECGDGERRLFTRDQWKMTRRYALGLCIRCGLPRSEWLCPKCMRRHVQLSERCPVDGEVMDYVGSLYKRRCWACGAMDTKRDRLARGGKRKVDGKQGRPTLRSRLGQKVRI